MEVLRIGIALLVVVVFSVTSLFAQPNDSDFDCATNSQVVASEFADSLGWRVVDADTIMNDWIENVAVYRAMEHYYQFKYHYVIVYCGVGVYGVGESGDLEFARFVQDVFRDGGLGDGWLSVVRGYQRFVLDVDEERIVKQERSDLIDSLAADNCLFLPGPYVISNRYPFTWRFCTYSKTGVFAHFLEYDGLMDFRYSLVPLSSR